MEIVFHAHHAVISDDLRARAERVVHKAAARLRRAVDATVRFEEDGPTRRVEIVLHAPRQRPVVALGEGRLFGPALAAAAARLQAQVAKAEAPHLRARRVGPAVAAGGADEADEADDAMTTQDELDLIDDALDEALDDAANGVRRASSGS